MRDRAALVILSVGVACSTLAIIIGVVKLLHQYKPAAHPVACADIPESNQRIIIIRDGQVECHYKITKVKEKKK